jgi:hypothetical protein
MRSRHEQTWPGAFLCPYFSSRIGHQNRTPARRHSARPIAMAASVAFSEPSGPVRRAKTRQNCSQRAAEAILAGSPSASLIALLKKADSSVSKTSTCSGVSQPAHRLWRDWDHPRVNGHDVQTSAAAVGPVRHDRGKRRPRAAAAGADRQPVREGTWRLDGANGQRPAAMAMDIF